jgi:hypothetical protein
MQPNNVEVGLRKSFNTGLTGRRLCVGGREATEVGWERRGSRDRQLGLRASVGRKVAVKEWLLEQRERGLKVKRECESGRERAQ